MLLQSTKKLLQSRKNFPQQSLPTDLTAEYLIGVHETDGDDPVNRLAMFQRQLELVSEEGKRLAELQGKLDKARKSTENPQDETVNAALDLAAAKTKHSAAVVDLRQLAKRMGVKWQHELMKAFATQEQARTPAQLRVISGEPMDMFNPPTYAACFAEFFYGDCCVNQERPRERGKDLVSSTLKS